MDPAEAVLQEKALKFMCSMPRSLWLGCSSLADSMPSLRCLYNPGTGALPAFQNSSEREDCNNDEPPRKIIPEKNSLRQTYNSCARLCLNQETVCLGSTAMKTENCVAKTEALPIHQALLLMSTSVQDIQVQPTKLTKLSIVSKMVENECVCVYIHTQDSQVCKVA